MATFFERLGAYIIDMIIVSVLFFLICFGLGNEETKSSKLMESLDDKLISGEITSQEYLNEYKVVLYDYQRDNVLTLSISVALTIAYFAVFQYFNKGQTLGKKLLKIRVIDKDTRKPAKVWQGIIRSIFTLSIASGVLNILFVYILNRNTYYIEYALIIGLELIFTVISAMFILYRKNKRGLHDMMANTEVIKERG